MPVINILPPLVADMIAAGEVVERPASVIKELMENSIDAGAQNIIVEIKGGGAVYIRVTDDGCGMAPEDAGVAFLRHATSKLHDEHGLEAIETMGFRGEALAAISAVSEVELTTRRACDDMGVHMTLKAGDIQDMTPTGCPAGTTMVVRSLFFNTPARRKFLKSDRSESSACIQTALRCALGHPEISVRFLKDGQEEFFSPGDSRLESCVYTLLGRDMAKDMLLVDSDSEGMHLTGYVSSPSAGRGNRSSQYFYCNGRFIRSTLLQSALEQAYKNTLLTGRFPACVLRLTTSCADVDVNIHPAKAEVKFVNEKSVFDLVYHAVCFTLGDERRITAEPEVTPRPERDFDDDAYDSRPAPSFTSRPRPPFSSGGALPFSSASELPFSSKPEPSYAAKPGPKSDFYLSMSAKEFREQGGLSAFSSGRVSASGSAAIRPASDAGDALSGTALHSYEDAYQTRMDMSGTRNAPVFDLQSPDLTAFSPSVGSDSVENSVQNVEKSELPDHKIVGEALRTYIIVECGDELIFIDKHAAHERMIFDRLKAQKRELSAQTLLVSAPLRLSPEEAELIENNAELLSELGFEIEPIGEREYLIRAIPAGMDAHDAVPAVEEICEKLRRGKAPDPQSARDEILHTVACKAAIKAGWDNDIRELERIAQAVLSGSVKYCPHGRPVSAVTTKKDLEKMFKRIV